MFDDRKRAVSLLQEWNTTHVHEVTLIYQISTVPSFYTDWRDSFVVDARWFFRKISNKIMTDLRHHIGN